MSFKFQVWSSKFQVWSFGVESGSAAVFEYRALRFELET